VRVWAQASGRAPVERGDRSDILGSELEVEEIEVLDHALAMRCLREDHVATLEVPAQSDLRGGPPQPLRDATDRRVFEYAPLAYRRPGLVGDSSSGVRRTYLLVPEAGMDLDLIDSRDDVG